jgi:hypothetical protein
VWLVLTEKQYMQLKTPGASSGGELGS